MLTQEQVIRQIIDWSLENTSGTVVSRCGIKKIVAAIYKDPKNHTVISVDMMVDENESGRGYLIKSCDIVSALPFKI